MVCSGSLVFHATIWQQEEDGEEVTWQETRYKTKFSSTKDLTQSGLALQAVDEMLDTRLLDASDCVL